MPKMLFDDQLGNFPEMEATEKIFGDIIDDIIRDPVFCDPTAADDSSLLSPQTSSGIHLVLRMQCILIEYFLTIVEFW